MQILLALLPFLILFGLAVVCTVLLAGALFHLRERVAFVPTGNRVVRAMLDSSFVRDGETLIDLGAGDARFLIEAKKKFPASTVTGYEGAWWVCMLGRLRLWWTGTDATLHHRDFFTIDLQHADVVFTYLSTHAMARLLPKFHSELRDGARVVSHAFRLPGIVPAHIIKVQMQFGEAKVYVYEAPFTTQTAPRE